MTKLAIFTSITRTCTFVLKMRSLTWKSHENTIFFSQLLSHHKSDILPFGVIHISQHRSMLFFATIKIWFPRTYISMLCTQWQPRDVIWWANLQEYFGLSHWYTWVFNLRWSSGQKASNFYKKKSQLAFIHRGTQNIECLFYWNVSSLCAF